MSNESNVAQLQTILEASTGRTISYSEAFEFGSDLVEFLKLLAEPSLERPDNVYAEE